MNKLYGLIFILIITFLFSACENETEKKEAVKEKEITYLSKNRVIDNTLGISYQVPFDWEEMPAALSEKFVARLNSKNKNDLIIYSPKSFYYNENSSSLLRVGEVSLKQNSETKLLTPQMYVQLFTKYNSELSVVHENILNNGFEMIMLTIEKGNLLSFKIVFQNRKNDIIQFDFSISNKNSDDLKPIIDASIKSIALL